jgi:2',3'-cyclic-nucleotide 2'-phosphodiesterase/3'-nucleotidase
LIAIVIVAAAGFVPIALAAADESSSPRLTVLHTSDLHGQVMPFDDARNRPSRGSLTRVATVVDRIRNESAHPVMVLDSGDTIQGTPFEQFLHVKWSESSPTIEAMNLIGYDAMAVGNHEFNFGLDVLRRAEALADFPFLSANTIDVETGEPAFRFCRPTPSMWKPASPPSPRTW